MCAGAWPSLRLPKVTAAQHAACMRWVWDPLFYSSLPTLYIVDIQVKMVRFGALLSTKTTTRKFVRFLAPPQKGKVRRHALGRDSCGATFEPWAQAECGW